MTTCQEKAAVIEVGEETLDQARIINTDFNCKTSRTQLAIESQNIIAKKPLYYRFIKRLFDIVFSLLVIVIAFVPMLILSIFVAIDTKAFPIYSQVRIGRKGPFCFYKLRSMVKDSNNVEKYFTPEQLEQWQKEHKVDDDPRVTKLGRFIRKTSLDEIPQFINVALGQMSVIGPRCITAEELHWFGSDVELLLSVPQGITGAWQVSERNNVSFENGTRQEIELYYCSNSNLEIDFKIFIATFTTMFIKKTGK